jgi:alanine dehydrogenase
MNTQTLLLSLSDVERSIDMDGIIETVENTFKAHGARKVVMPAKITLDMSALGIPNWMNAMPAYVESAKIYGIKWAGGFIQNPSKHNLPYVMATMILNDPSTGIPLAIMDATYITNMRTGATGAVAAKYLALKESKIAAFIGSGVQAHTSLHALSKIFNLHEIRSSDINIDTSNSLVKRAQELGIEGRAIESKQEACKNADIIVIATTANEPLLWKEWIKPGAFLAKLGSYQELDDSLTLGVDKIIVDHREQAEHRGELAHLFHQNLIKQEDIYAEIGDIVIGTVPGRESEDEIIIAELVGMGSEDIAIGSLVLNRARELGIGKCMNFLS